MTRTNWFALAAAVPVAWLTAFAQQTQPAPVSTISSVMDRQLSRVERQLVQAAEAMPEDRYSFTPTHGDFDGVRTFALEIKHVASANLVFFSAILEQDPPVAIDLSGPVNGPERIQTKEQILKYLKDSFALGHRAFATLTAANAVTPVMNPPITSMNTRLDLAAFSLAHASDHYGQMAIYLRENGITPPASKGQPPANPSRK